MACCYPCLGSPGSRSAQWLQILEFSEECVGCALYVSSITRSSRPVAQSDTTCATGALICSELSGQRFYMAEAEPTRKGPSAQMAS
jgi:hypothetical protein